MIESLLIELFNDIAAKLNTIAEEADSYKIKEGLYGIKNDIDYFIDKASRIQNVGHSLLLEDTNPNPKKKIPKDLVEGNKIWYYGTTSTMPKEGTILRIVHANDVFSQPVGGIFPRKSKEGENERIIVLFSDGSTLDASVNDIGRILFLSEFDIYNSPAAKTSSEVSSDQKEE